MKRFLLITATIAVVSLTMFLLLSVERVAPDHEGLRVSDGGAIDVYSPGFHLVLPGYSDFIVYPTGEQSYRVPEAGDISVVSHSGEEFGVAFRFDLFIPPGSSQQLYERFSEDFEPGFSRLVIAAAEITAAAASKDVDRERYLADVVETVNEELTAVGITVRDAALESGGEAQAVDYPESVAVSARPPRRVVVVGIDGGDWLNLEPLVASGRLPNFKKIIENGTTGPLETIEPMLSPLLWTTIATGKLPEDHGILNFTVDDPATGQRKPITRYYRRVDALWNMVGDYGRKVSVAGWLATDPAESINGTMVSDKIGYLAYAAPGDTNASKSGSVSPAGRHDEIAALVVKAADVEYDEFSRLVNIPRAEFLAHRSGDFDLKNSINNLIYLYASTLTYRAIALHLLDDEHPDVMAVYFELVDAVSHLFMLHAAPRMTDVPEEEYERFKHTVEEAYVIQDEILGDIIERLDEQTVLLVVSDHGFKSGASRLRNRPEIWAGNAAKWHRLNGIVALYGPGIRKGHKMAGATILDVAPTVLALSGLPRAADMPGKILVNAFEPALSEELNPNTVATLERDRPDEAPQPGADGAASEETLKKLEALGYLTPDNADSHNNLGQRYQERGDFVKAIAEYEQAIALRPDFHSAYNNLAVCYGKLKRYDKAEAALRKTIEIKPDDFYAMNNLAVMYIETKQLARAIEIGRRAVATEPGYVNGRVTLGSAMAMSGDSDGAQVQFEEALRLDPENQTVIRNLRMLEQQRRGGQ